MTVHILPTFISNFLHRLPFMAGNAHPENVPENVAEECPICHESEGLLQTVHTAITPNGEVAHKFHANCFNGWVQTCQRDFRPVTCPTCRAELRNQAPDQDILEVEHGEAEREQHLSLMSRIHIAVYAFFARHPKISFYTKISAFVFLRNALTFSFSPVLFLAELGSTIVAYGLMRFPFAFRTINRFVHQHRSIGFIVKLAFSVLILYGMFIAAESIVEYALPLIALESTKSLVTDCVDNVFGGAVWAYFLNFFSSHAEDRARYGR